MHSRDPWPRKKSTMTLGNKKGTARLEDQLRFTTQAMLELGKWAYFIPEVLRSLHQGSLISVSSPQFSENKASFCFFCRS